MPAKTARAREPAADPALLTHWLTLGSATVPGRPQDVRTARRFVAAMIGASHPHAETALLLTSELVANAVTHSRSGLPGGMVDVAVAVRGPALLISVTDDGSPSSLPAVSARAGGQDSVAEEHGNGLILVASLADAWGYQSAGCRTMVWFMLAFPGICP